MLIDFPANREQVGGLSGRPLFPYALNALKTLRPLLPPSIPILGCGGITTGSDALAMAGAGASIVQLYTSFGYRGVGTPRLLKDEITEGLQGKAWKDVVGRDWEGKEMGWNEKRLEHETDALKREAEGLGQLLREAWEKDDTDRLVKEAQAVLTGKPTPSAQTAQSDQPAQAPVQQGQNLVETRHAATIEAVPAQETPEQLLTIEAAVVPEPVTAPVEIQVKVVPTIPVVPEEDAWSASVRSGQRRLV